MDNSPKGLRHSITALEAEFHKFLRDAPWQNIKQAPGPQTQSQEKSRSGPGEVVVISPPPQDTGSTTDTKKKSFPWWRIFEGAGILAAVVVAGVNLFQWRDLRHNFAIDERPWVGIAGVETENGTVAGDKFSFESVSLKLTNSGKTPALNIGKYSVTFQTVRFNSKPPENNTANTSAIAGSGAMAPNTTIVQPIMPSTITDNFILDKNPDRTAHISVITYIVGQFSYSDIFPNSREHTTKFCLARYPAATNFRLCPFGQFMD